MDLEEINNKSKKIEKSLNNIYTYVKDVNKNLENMHSELDKVVEDNNLSNYMIRVPKLFFKLNYHNI